jgi:hypothetical protein
MTLDHEMGGDQLIAHLDVKSGYDEDNVGNSIFRALLPSLTTPSILRQWKMSSTTVPEQDRDRRLLRQALEQQAEIVIDISRSRPGIYTLLGNWRILPRRGHQRLEFWI